MGRKYWGMFGLALLAMGGLSLAAGLGGGGEAAAGRGPLFKPSTSPLVYYVPQLSKFEAISSAEMVFLERVLREADENNARAVIFEIDTPGGDVMVAFKYISILARYRTPTVAFVNPNGISAGLIIALAADRVAINPSGVIGDAMPMQMTPGGPRPVTEEPPERRRGDEAAEEKPADQPAAPAEDNEKKEEKKEDGDADPPMLRRILEELEKFTGEREREKDQPASERRTESERLADQKFLTVFFKMLQALAEKNERPVRVIRAMGDPYQELSEEEDGYDFTEAKPLTLTAAEAQNLGVVDYISRDRRELLEQLGLADCEIRVVKKSGLDQIMSFLAHPLIASILIMLGLTGIFIEVRTPGFGVPGVLGLFFVTLFFIGHMGAGDTGWGPAVLFFVGLLLLLIEVFVIPGFGITGVMGIGCVLGSMVWAFGTDNIALGVAYTGGSMAAAAVLTTILAIYVLPKSTAFKRITLSQDMSGSLGFSSHEERAETLVGTEGITQTPLRPTGIVIFDGQRRDVVTQGGFVDKGVKVRIMSVKGLQVVVEASESDIA